MKRLLHIFIVCACASTFFVNNITAQALQSDEKSVIHVNGFYPALNEAGYQNVHTVERTIYYNTDQYIIPLYLAERNFLGYQRWYNYTTDNGSGIPWHAAPKGNINNNAPFVQIGDLGWFGWSNKHDGVLMRKSPVDISIPEINIQGWTGNYTIACDVSNYIDYEFTKNGDQIITVTEPRLSYRQLFHFRPASEMADKFTTLRDGEYLEEYTYMAPTGIDVFLATEYRYDGNNAENCYFYYDGGGIKRVTSATWSDGATQSGAFAKVSSTEQGTQEYYLTANEGRLRIAKFTVTYVDRNTYGPVKETSVDGNVKAIKTYQEIKNEYEVLEYNDFSFGHTPTDETEQYLSSPMPWEQSSYGFYTAAYPRIHPQTTNGQADGGDVPFPFYGEYAIVNAIYSAGWLKKGAANHVDGVLTGANDQPETSAAQQGYALYVDGTTSPGVVASISTKVTICADRRMYCSVWLRNPAISDNEQKVPTFRCNVQGRNQLPDGTYTPWTDVGVYFAGSIAPQSGWQQLNFSFNSDITYTECRVQIYNFCEISPGGNDFMLDDLCVYADKLPMASYQTQTDMCCSPNHQGTTFSAAVLRVDYGVLDLDNNDDTDNYQYYQIFNKTTSQALVLSSTSISPYYHDNEYNEQYGSIKIIPTYQPQPGEICTPDVLVNNLLDEYNDDSAKPLCGKCFVPKNDIDRARTQGDYYMYVVHIIPTLSGNRIEENYLQESCEYTIRMTNSPADLNSHVISCTKEIPMPATQHSLFRLTSEQMESTLEFLCNSTNNCPNELYTLEAFIRKDSDPFSKAGETEGTYLADWMYGHAFDEVYCLNYLHKDNDAEYAERKNSADAQFESKYGRNRQQVTDAFLDLRRPDPENANYMAETFDEIVITEFSDYNSSTSQSEHYETLKYLHEQGWLQLASSSVSFYLGSENTARYWVFPIENSAVAIDRVTQLHDCPEPRWVQVTSKHTDYFVNVSPGIDITDPNNQLVADPRTGARIPNVRVLARLVNNIIQIPIHQASANDYLVNFTGEDAYLFQTNDNNISNPKIVQYTCHREHDVITLQPAADNTATLEIGKEYTLSVRMRDKDNQHRTAGDNCDVGKIYVKLLILPDIVQWHPTTPDKSWHNDANWKGYPTTVENFHYAPIAGSGVVIPTNTYPELTVIANEDPHPYPMDANFALIPTCEQIYFQPEAMMLNQHLLQHDEAFVDLVVPNKSWNSIAVPISGVVSGDLYIPHEGGRAGCSVESKEPFEVKTFQGSRLKSSAAFLFWLSAYNKPVQKVNENPANTTTTISTNTAAFASTNSLDHSIAVGEGYQLLGFGPTGLDAGEDLVIRLPKSDNVYYYYNSSGVSNTCVAIDRTTPSKLIYSPDKSIELTNNIESEYFMFGNPTMAMIDLTKCLPSEATIYKMVNDSWGSGTKVSLPIDEAYRYLEPMQSILVQMPNASKSVQIKLKAEALTTPEKIAAEKGNNIAPRRNMSANDLQLMTIYADVYGTKARCLVGTKFGMADSYALGEDALFISSGVEAEVNSATATSPVNMYTVSDNVPLMVDIRENMDTIPIALLIKDSYRTEKLIFTFNLTDNWDKECYFYDSKTGDRIRIVDGTLLEMEMPLNHETRYFIIGPDKTSNGGDVVTNISNPTTFPVQVWAYSPNHGRLVVASNDIIKHVALYDPTGHMVLQQSLDLQYCSTTLTLPSGVYIVKAIMRDNSEQLTKAVVK